MTTNGANREVGIGEAISLFFRNYANFNGRSSRGAYWWWLLSSIVIRLGILVLEHILLGADANDLGGVGPFTILFLLATLVPEIALGARRLHDTDKSGWWLLVGFVPVLGWLLILWFMAQPGVRAANTFGPDVEAGRPAQAA